MGWSFKKWRRQRALQNAALPDKTWHAAISGLSILRGLSEVELHNLRELVTLFLNEKQLVAAGGLHLNDELRIRIAAQACLPILNLGLDYYAGWVSVIVYPDEFVPEHEFTDQDGVVHLSHYPVKGESWERGPVILSGADAMHSGEQDGVNVVIHEFAHKLDMLNGAMNGFPPLHQGMSSEQWSQSFTTAFADFSTKVNAGAKMAIDSYGAESPAEFFAVMSEAFFEIPNILLQEYPEVYQQLKGFYRQDTVLRKYA